ncbi:MAG: ABC transporter ATP-binding protein [Alphaproteobacteria bacterium]|jgi:putative ABC transport system ATP-binding protein|nr:ABC transporter ATP-binding protein [Alphaproteobacteria bacterium]
MKSTKYAVECQEIKKVYNTGENQVQALRGINLKVIEGELLILAGPSGCGKTTLISIIAGILHQTEGGCSLFDEDVNNMTETDRLLFRAQNIGFVFQQFNLMPTLTAAENVAIPLIINNVPLNESISRAAKLLARMGLEGRQESLPKQLSGGQQQRVAIARAIIHNPKLVVCDEPTSSLDAETGHKVMEIMKSLAAENNRTIIVVTHDARIFGFADRVARMEDGRINNIISSKKAISHEL